MRRWLIAATLAVVISVLCRTEIVETAKTGTPAPLSPAHVRTPPQPPVTYDFAVPVLMYHRVAPLSDKDARNRLVRSLTTQPEVFDQHMRYLVETGYTFVSTEQIADAVAHHQPLPVRAVAITFDDGYACLYWYAYPILRRYRIPATVFMVTGKIGATDHLSWERLLEMRDGGILIESHTVRHADLATSPPDLLERELADSRSTLEEGLGCGLTSIAYPAGSCDSHVVMRVMANGYSAGWMKSGGPVRPSDNAYLLPRIGIRGDVPLEQFRRIIGQTPCRQH